jgi:hypothetical protein
MFAGIKTFNKLTNEQKEFAVKFCLAYFEKNNFTTARDLSGLLLKSFQRQYRESFWCSPDTIRGSIVPRLRAIGCTIEVGFDDKRRSGYRLLTGMKGKNLTPDLLGIVESVGNHKKKTVKVIQNRICSQIIKAIREVIPQTAMSLAEANQTRDLLLSMAAELNQAIVPMNRALQIDYKIQIIPIPRQLEAANA